MLNTVLIDAGPLIALFDKDDRYHEKIKSFIRGKSYLFITTTAVITEVSYMLNFDIRAQSDFFNWILNKGVILRDIGPADISRVIGLIKRYADLPMDFADATLVIAAEKTGIKSIISIDADFDIYRLPGKEWIKNLFPRDRRPQAF
jgi:predicted nucleic acid-binding protein